MLLHVREEAEVLLHLSIAGWIWLCGEEEEGEEGLCRYVSCGRDLRGVF